MTQSGRRSVRSVVAITVIVGIGELAGWLRQPRSGYARCGRRTSIRSAARGKASCTCPAPSPAPSGTTSL